MLHAVGFSVKISRNRDRDRLDLEHGHAVQYDIDKLAIERRTVRTKPEARPSFNTIRSPTVFRWALKG